MEPQKRLNDFFSGESTGKGGRSELMPLAQLVLTGLVGTAGKKPQGPLLRLRGKEVEFPFPRARPTHNTRTEAHTLLRELGAWELGRMCHKAERTASCKSARC